MSRKGVGSRLPFLAIQLRTPSASKICSVRESRRLLSAAGIIPFLRDLRVLRGKQCCPFLIIITDLTKAVLFIKEEENEKYSPKRPATFIRPFLKRPTPFSRR